VSDVATAAAFAESWNHIGSVYTREQFEEWLAPVDPRELAGKEVLELGFGNGSLLAHMGTYGPRRLAGIELGDTLEQTRRNLAHLDPSILDLRRGDLTTADLGAFDFVYCIGVIHHLSDPRRGFEALLRHTKPGGRFHGWVYAREGNALIRATVEPARRIASRLPWWLTKYGIALPLVTPYFLYAKLAAPLLRRAPRLARALPLGEYTVWIGRERFRFFHHVAFDQLVTPRTTYIARATIHEWLRDERVDPSTTYVRFRNGNSWIFGGRRR
jgi:SAM-dependent methyltransferase